MQPKLPPASADLAREGAAGAGEGSPRGGEGVSSDGEDASRGGEVALRGGEDASPGGGEDASRGGEDESPGGGEDASPGGGEDASPGGGGGSREPGPWYSRALPFALAIGLLAVVLARIDLRAAVGALARVNVPAFVAFSAVFLLALLAADAFATAVVFRPVLGRSAFRDLFIVRGASYLPSILNHHVGQAFVTVFLARSHGVPLARAAGGTIIVYASWAACLLALGGGAVIAAGFPAAWLLLPLGAGAVYLAVIALRPAVLARVSLLRPLFEAGVTGHLAAAAARLPHAAVLFLGTWLSFRFFGVSIPIAAALSYVPVLMVIVTLPITPQGLGTRDIVATTLFLRFAPGATNAERGASIAACTASWAFVLMGLQALLGLALLHRATRLFTPPAGTPRSSPSPAAPPRAPRRGRGQ